MKRFVLLLLNCVQWMGFAVWCIFWMSAAVLCGLCLRNGSDIALGWARRYWGPGVVRVARGRLVRHSGFEPEPGKPYIFAMNHQSLFDIAAAFVGIPVNIRFIAKKSLKWIPFLGWYMSATGMIFLDRKNHQQAVRSLDEACQKIRSGTSILVYPEGTRSRDGRILPFKKGPFVMAIQAGVPIVPVAVEGAQNLLERDSLLVQGGRVDMVLGQSIPTEGLRIEDRDALMQRVRNALIDLHMSIGGPGGDRETFLSGGGSEADLTGLPSMPAIPAMSATMAKEDLSPARPTV